LQSGLCNCKPKFSLPGPPRPWASKAQPRGLVGHCTSGHPLNPPLIFPTTDENYAIHIVRPQHDGSVIPQREPTTEYRKVQTVSVYRRHRKDVGSAGHPRLSSENTLIPTWDYPAIPKRTLIFRFYRSLKVILFDQIPVTSY